MFVADNVLEGVESGHEDNWTLIRGAEEGNRAAAPFPVVPVTTQSAAEAYRAVLERAGATLPVRDAVDARIVEQVKTGTGRIIDSQQDVGGWPAYRNGEPPSDTDSDGMPDEWESRYGLDPDEAVDTGHDGDGDGYTDLEEFLNGTDPRARDIAGSG